MPSDISTDYILCIPFAIKAFDFSGVDQITSDADFSSHLDVYTLDGVRIAVSIEGLTPGLYIVRQGNKSKKIAIK